MAIAKLAKKAAVAFLVASATLVNAGDARSEDPPAKAGGIEAVYGKIPEDQAETLVTGDRIRAVAASGSMTAIWETLEFGERVECLSCIPAVEPLLFDANSRTREIAAWWLRRRVLGVFGPGQSYERLTKTLVADGDARRRAFAAEALGEFLASPGIPLVANALAGSGKDADPRVRAAAAKALGRLNDDGKGALGRALADADPTVKAAALASATRVNSFVDVAGVVPLVFDADKAVRRRAVEVLESMNAKDAVQSLMTTAETDEDANVRMAACHALGTLGDPAARSTLSAIADKDASNLVRDLAKIALRRL